MAGVQNSQATFDFHHNPHAASLLQGLQKLRADNLLTDVILCVSGKEIPCHRNVLAACSEYFRAMFCNDHREAKEDKVLFHEVSSSTLELLVEFAYTSRVTITEDNVVELLEGANFFQIQSMHDACVKFISNNLNAKNCLQMVHVGSMLSCPDLEKEATRCAMDDFEAARKTPEFLHLTKDQLITLISSDDLSAREETVYEAVMAWINHDTGERNEEMKELLELVRFPFMDKVYFLDNVESNEAVRKSCKDIISEALRYQMFPSEVQSPRTRPRHVSGLREAVVVIGGIKKHEPQDNVFDYKGSTNLITMTDSAEPSRSSWVIITSIPVDLNTNSGFAAAVLGTSEFILCSGQKVVLYQPELNSWSDLAPKNVHQYYHKLAVLHGKIYAIGGISSPHEDPVLADVEVYDRSQHKWTAGVPLPQPRYTHAVAVLHGNIYVIGGFDHAKNPTSTVYSFTPGDSHWQSQKSMPVAHGSLTASVLDGSIYVAGVQSQVLCYKPGEHGGSWSVAAKTGVRNCGMTVFRGKLYICGGYNNGIGSTAVFCLDLKTKSLNCVGDMPMGLYAHCCVTVLKCY